MNHKLSKKQKFLLAHPFCFACGEPAVQTDHLPSRACFDKKIWPEGFEFPVCHSCNHATENDEQMIAALSRAHSGPDAPIDNAELTKYLQGASNNDFPLFSTLLKRVVKELPDGTELVEMGPGTREVFKRVLPKWGRAFHYLETREILPPGQHVLGGHFTVPDLETGHAAGELIKVCKPKPVKRGNTDLGPQFGFGHAASEDNQLFLYIVVFRRSIGAWMTINKKEPDTTWPGYEKALLPPVRALKQLS